MLIEFDLIRWGERVFDWRSRVIDGCKIARSETAGGKGMESDLEIRRAQIECERS
jgi:hypothetical protein